MISMRIGDRRPLTREDAARVAAWLHALYGKLAWPTEEEFTGAFFEYDGNGEGSLYTEKESPLFGQNSSGHDGTMVCVPVKVLCAEGEEFKEIV